MIPTQWSRGPLWPRALRVSRVASAARTPCALGMLSVLDSPRHACTPCRGVLRASVWSCFLSRLAIFLPCLPCALTRSAPSSAPHARASTTDRARVCVCGRPGCHGQRAQAWVRHADTRVGDPPARGEGGGAAVGDGRRRRDNHLHPGRRTRKVGFTAHTTTTNPHTHHKTCTHTHTHIHTCTIAPPPHTCAHTRVPAHHHLHHHHRH